MSHLQEDCFFGENPEQIAEALQRHGHFVMLKSPLSVREGSERYILGKALAIRLLNRIGALDRVSACSPSTMAAVIMDEIADALDLPDLVPASYQSDLDSLKRHHLDSARGRTDKMF